jgi:hypothetical protein
MQRDYPGRDDCKALRVIQKELKIEIENGNASNDVQKVQALAAVNTLLSFYQCSI